jgi:plasmid maintenance system antidote protein VapI
MPMYDPPHPGEHIRHDCLEPLGLTVTKAAEVLGVSRKALSELVNGRSGISPRDGDSPVQGVWRQSRGLAADAAEL